MGTMVNATNMNTVPETTGVTMRRTNGSHKASENWKRAETTIRLPIMAGPPWVSAMMQTAMKMSPEPVMSRCPVPSRPKRHACNAVAAPQTNSAEKTAHER